MAESETSSAKNGISRRRFLTIGAGVAGAATAAVAAAQFGLGSGDPGSTSVPAGPEATPTSREPLIEGTEKVKLEPIDTQVRDPKTNELSPIGPLLQSTYEADSETYGKLRLDQQSSRARLVEFTDKKGRQGEALVVDIGYNLLASARLPYDRAIVSMVGEKQGQPYEYAWNLTPKQAEQIWNKQNNQGPQSNGGNVSLMMAWGEYAPSGVINGWESGGYAAFNRFDRPKSDLSNIRGISVELVKDQPQRQTTLKSTLK